MQKRVQDLTQIGRNFVVLLSIPKKPSGTTRNQKPTRERTRKRRVPKAFGDDYDGDQKQMISARSELTI